MDVSFELPFGEVILATQEEVVTLEEVKEEIVVSCFRDPFVNHALDINFH